MRLKIFSCAALFAAQVLPANAADEQGRYAANYPATMECEKLLQSDQSSQETYAVAAFTEGWFAAHAKLTPDVFDFTPWQSIEYLVAQLRAYCTAQPGGNLITGLNALTEFLAPDAMTTGEQPRAVSNDNQVTFVYPSVLEDIQARLRAKGFATEQDSDPVSGLADYQESEGLPVSGLPDQLTLQRLFSD